MSTSLETSSLRMAEQVSRTGEFELACSAHTAFPLFSPEGERGWIHTWNPQPVFPNTIEFRGDTVFREGLGAEEAVWTIVNVDWQQHRAEYVRVAPASHTAHIVVKIEACGPNRSRVVVSYAVTGFGQNSGVLLGSFSESAYADKMRNWQKRIGEYLDSMKSRALDC
jgi:hypothetical protein